MDDSLLNFSRVETDPFVEEPLDYNATETSFSKPSTFTLVLSYTYLFAELANFFLCIAAVVADVLLIYFIFRYKRLRKGLNLYIANYAIMNLCYYVVAPIFLIFHILFYSGFSYFRYVFCYVSMIENSCQVGSFFIVMIMGLEWTFSIAKITLKIPMNINNIKYLIIYMFMLMFLILSFVGCTFRISIFTSLPYYFMPFIIFPLIYMHSVRRRTILNEEQLKTEYVLWVFTIAVGCFVPIYILDLLLSFFARFIPHILIAIVFLLEYTLSFISSPSPVFILYYLIKWNKHFKMAFDTTFKRSVRTYGADNLDDASDNEDIVQDDGQKNREFETNGLDRSDIMVL